MGFPTLVTSNLAGRRMALPGELPWELGVLLMWFRAEQQATIQSWVPYVRQIELVQEGIRHYLAPVMGSSTSLVRAVRHALLRARTRDAATRERTLPLYVDAPRLREPLGLRGRLQPCVVLVDRSAEVWWLAEGPVSPDKVQSLAAVTERARAAVQGDDWRQ